MMYYEHVVDYLDRYGTLTKVVIFNQEGEKLFSVPDEVEFGRRHLIAVLKCMSDGLHPLAGVSVGTIVYRCLRVDGGLLVGRSDTEEFVAYKTDDAVIIGFTDRERSGDCCLTDVKNVERELHRQPTILDECLGPPGYQEVEEEAITVPQTQTKPMVRFQEDRSARLRTNGIMEEGESDTEDRDFEMVKGDQQGLSMLDDENEGSFENVALEIEGNDFQAPRVSAEEVELDIIDRTEGF